MGRDELLTDVLSYAERMFVRWQLLLAAAVILGLIAAGQWIRYLYEPMFIEFLAASVNLSLAVVCLRQSVRLQHLTRLFQPTRSTAGSQLPLRIGPWRNEAFCPIPARYIRHAEFPTSAGVCWDLQTAAQSNPELRIQLEACMHAHGQLNNHDAANLLLMETSQRIAKGHMHAIR